MSTSTRGIPRPNARGPRPQAWLSGPDPEEHRRYRVFIQQRNQAQWREEGWDLSFDVWKQIWAESGQWLNRGRVKGTWCMTRRDWSTPWTRDNTVIVTREEHARMQGAAVASGWRSPAQKRQRARKGLPADRQRPGRKARNACADNT